MKTKQKPLNYPKRLRGFMRKTLRDLGATGYWVSPAGVKTISWHKPSWWERFKESILYGYEWVEAK